MKLPAKLPASACWLPCTSDVATLREWCATHAPRYVLRGSLPRGVVLHAARPVIATQPAAWRLRGEVASLNTGEATWCAALDPVALVADQRDVRLAAWPVPGLDDVQARALLHDVAQHLTGDQDSRLATATLIQGSATRWYVLGTGAAPAIDNPTPLDVMGQPLRDFPTGGDDAQQWRRISTELQMLLHAHPVNAAREQAGYPPINGIWWFGTSSLTEATTTRQLVTLQSDDTFWRGCWQAHDASASIAPLADTQSVAGNAIAGQLHSTLTRAVDALKKNEVRNVVISVGNMALTLARRSLLQRFLTWRTR